MMLTVEPTEAINLVERVLRDLVRTVLGSAWQLHKSIDLSKLEGKRLEDQAKRRGSIVSDDLLNYTEFYQLKAIVLDNWNAFEPALKKRKYVEVYLDRLEGFRNPAMHSRSLLPFERQLVEGIVGEFRNLVTIYRSTRGPDMKHYPEIDEVTDSFGRVVTHETSGVLQDRLDLHVGDVVTFNARATDPYGRPLRWVMRPSLEARVMAEAEGEEVTLSWTVGPEDVREHLAIAIQLYSNGEFHKYGKHLYDDLAFFIFGVIPPL